MSSVDIFLQTDESIVERIDSEPDDHSVDYSIFVLERPDLTTGDEVLLEIRASAEPCVLIGGNFLKLDILQGFGRLAIIELATGQMRNIALEKGTEAKVPADNTLYWYENTGDVPLVVRDHCGEFDPTNEPRLSDLVQALTQL